ncbi:MAG: nucleotidyltransferase domain-containing protein [Patescibacteria group bacterium]
MSKDLEKIKEIAVPILKQNGVEFAGVFGSVARGESRVGSDVDILVKFASRPTFAGYLRLDDALRASLGREIDLVTVGGVNKFLLPEIEKDLMVLYGQRPNLSFRN